MNSLVILKISWVSLNYTQLAGGTREGDCLALYKVNAVLGLEQREEWNYFIFCSFGLCVCACI